MTKQEAYEELCKKFDKGKREWSFDEMADVLEKNMNVPKKQAHKIFHEMAEEQKKGLSSAHKGDENK